MRLIVNGTPSEHGGDGSLQALLRELGADPDRVALMVNGTVIAKDRRTHFVLKENDEVEILVLAAGG